VARVAFGYMTDGDTEESDQLPEEAPSEQVPDDAGGSAREKATENPGGADEGDEGAQQATGNRKNAGQE
jgi:hypothetical protein